MSISSVSGFNAYHKYTNTTFDAVNAASKVANQSVYNENGEWVSGPKVDHADFNYTYKPEKDFYFSYRHYELQDMLADLFHGDTMDGVAGVFDDILTTVIDVNQRYGKMATPPTTDEMEEAIKLVYEKLREQINGASSRYDNKVFQSLYPNETGRYAYFNSNTYYKCQDLAVALNSYAISTAEKHGIDNIQFTGTAQATGYLEYWMFARNGLMAFDSFDLVPPRDMTFIFRQEAYEITAENSTRYGITTPGLDGKEDGGVIYITVPNHLNLFKKEHLSLWDMISKRYDESINVWMLDATNLLGKYTGDSWSRLNQFYNETVFNLDVGTLDIDCGMWSYQTDIAFHLNSGITQVAASSLEFADEQSEQYNQSVADFMNHITFRTRVHHMW